MDFQPTEQPIIEVAYQHRENNRIRCDICPQHCKLGEGGIGVCGGKQVIDDKLIAVNYAQVSSLHLDPIEKKPLFHFFPGCDILSVGPTGCNLSCKWCQNWNISQNQAPTRTILPNELADMVDALDGIGVAYTYAEPLIWYEYIRDAGKILHERDLVNVVISNGYINEKPLKDILPFTDAFNIDLKSSDDYCYQNHCGGRLSDVQRTIRMVFDSGRHLEITHLIVTGVGDELSKIEKLTSWIASVDSKIPLHLSRYFPSHKYNEPPTDLEVMRKAYEVAREKLDWVYLGNSEKNVLQDSHCPTCNNLLVNRHNFEANLVGLDGNRCANCHAKLNFHFELVSA
ncbi:AmmeMemoRadiSam system radical SAM enzyme [Calditrichota bacterium]